MTPVNNDHRARWEYTTHSATTSNRAWFSQQLNVYGAEGWELISVTESRDDGMLTLYAYFKRKWTFWEDENNERFYRFE